MKSKMLTTLDLYNGLQALTGKRSAYSVSQILSVSRVTAANWRDGKTMDDANAIAAANKLGLDPDFVLACIQAERAANAGAPPESVASWQRIAHRLATAASIGFISLSVVFVLLKSPVF